MPNLHRLDDISHVEREYASLDRLRLRRLDRTGWFRFDDLDEEQRLDAPYPFVARREKCVFVADAA